MGFKQTIRGIWNGSDGIADGTAVVNSGGYYDGDKTNPGIMVPWAVPSAPAQGDVWQTHTVSIPASPPFAPLPGDPKAHPGHMDLAAMRVELDEIRRLMATCCVCGGEGKAFFCDLCRHAVTEAREAFLREVARGLMDEIVG